MPRPSYSIPKWAQAIVNYVAPGRPWDGKPNKLQPPPEMIGSGLDPSQRVPAPILNWILGALGMHMVHLDGIEVQNWSGEITISALDPNQRGKTIAWNPIERTLYLVGSDSLQGQLWASKNGVSWNEDPFTFLFLGSVVVNPVNGYTVAATYIPSGPGRLYFKNVGGAWTILDPAGTKRWDCSVWNGHQSVFLFGGTDSLNHPTVYVGTATMSSVVAADLQGHLTYSPASVRFLACSSTGISLAIGTTDTFPAVFTEHTWKVTGDPTAQWADLGPVASIAGGWAAHPPADLQWDESRKVFVVICTAGEVYQSVNGEDWIQVAGFSTLERSFQDYTLAVNGGLYVAMVGNTGGQPSGLVFSGDGGVTWSRVAFPFSNLSAEPASLALVDDRFAIMSQSGAVCFSLRLK